MGHTHTGDCLQSIKLEGYGPCCFDPYAKVIAKRQGTEIHLSNVDTGVAQTLRGHKEDVDRLVFSPDGRFLVSMKAVVLRVWEAMTGVTHHPVKLHRQDEPVRSVSLSTSTTQGATSRDFNFTKQAIFSSPDYGIILT
jgi:WD40 repeat protein